MESKMEVFFMQSTHFAVKLDLDDSAMMCIPAHISRVLLSGLPSGGYI